MMFTNPDLSYNHSSRLIPKQSCTCVEKEVGGGAQVQPDVASVAIHGQAASGADLLASFS